MTTPNNDDIEDDHILIDFVRQERESENQFVGKYPNE